MSPDRSSVEEQLWQENLRVRTELLEVMPILSAADLEARLAAAGLAPEGTMPGWLRDRRVHAVEANGAELLPAFQFDADGQPRPVIREILALLPPDRSPWQVLFWFVSGNGWLAGDTPCERLDDPETVLMAAQQLAESTIG